MTRPSPTLAEPAALFADALSGADGTADPLPVVALPQTFADPLAERFPEPPRTITLPAMPVVQVQAPSAKDFFDHGDPRAATPRHAASSAEFARAARRVAVEKRDAAIAVRRAASGVAPAMTGQSRPARALPRGASYASRQRPHPAMPAPQVDFAARSNFAAHSNLTRQPDRQSRKSGGVWGALLAIVLFLLISGTGRQLLDAITDLLNR